MIKSKLTKYLILFLIIFAYHAGINVIVAGAARSFGADWIVTLIICAFATALISFASVYSDSLSKERER